MSTYTESVARNLEGLEAVSTGPCPGCPDCARARGMEVADYDKAYEAGEVEPEASFSWRGCEICGSTLGGDREEWHAIGSKGELLHFNAACVDCVVYLANGDEPE